MKIKIVSLLSNYKILKKLIIIYPIVIIVLIVGYLFLCHKQVNFSYAGDNCYGDLVLMPRLYKSSQNSGYRVGTKDNLTIAGYPIISRTICVSSVMAPTPNQKNTLKLSLAGNPVLGKKVVVQTSELSRVVEMPSEGQLVSIKEPLSFKLDQQDDIFHYQIQTEDGRSAECHHQTAVLSCDIQQLTLQQAQKYTLHLKRYYKEEIIGDIVASTVQTTLPTEVKQTSIAANGIIYDNPHQIVISMDRPVATVSGVVLEQADNKKEVATEVKSDGTQITVSFTEDLSRRVGYELKIDNIQAIDKGVLLNPYSLTFNTSGGPKVKSVNIPKKSINVGQDIVINFDQNLAPSQDLSKVVIIKSGVDTIAARLSTKGSTVTVNPARDFNLCEKFSVEVSAGVSSEFGFSGDSQWSFASRAICFKKVSIGQSVQGNSIEAYYFGSGSTKIMYVGATHGNEKSTKYLMDKWVKELDNNPDRLAANKTIIVIPNLNPDGFNSSSRFNAHGVDLNRNFPASDWKSSVTVPGGVLLPTGGGVTALSEPESSALVNVVQRENLRLVLTYHSTAGLVTANESGDSAGLTGTYAAKTGYKNTPHSANSSVFLYDTTGAFEDWLHDKRGIPAILIELASSTKDEFERNKEAMWAMALL